MMCKLLKNNFYVILILIMVIIGVIVALKIYNYFDMIDNDDIDWNELDYVVVDEKSDYEITTSGVYSIESDLKGTLVIDTLGLVKVILNGVRIVSNDGPAILIKNSGLTLIEVKDETVNYLEDSVNYNAFYDYATIFSNSKLVLDGHGTLYIKCNHQNGILANKLIVRNINYNVSCQ